MAPGRFLFVTWGGGGNVPPALGLAALLRERGHGIRFLASRELGDRVGRAGFEFQAFERAPPLDLGMAVEDQGQGFVRAMAGEEVARDVIDETRRDATDALVVDCMQFNALSAAELMGLPTAVFVHLLYEPWRMRPGLGEMLRSSIDEMRLSIGLAALTEDLVMGQMWDQHAAALVVTPREFDFPNADLPGNVRYVGPIFEPDHAETPHLPWNREETKPLVLVSFSSTYMNQEDVLRRSTEAVSSVDARCLVTLGGAVDAASLDAPSGVVVRDWLPHAAVLPMTSAVVTHAGHATVMAALAHGVPLVCLPMGRDQHSNARRVEAVGAGVAVSMDAGPEKIREAVQDVLGGEGYRAGASRMASIIRGYDNGARAIDELERMLD